MSFSLKVIACLQSGPWNFWKLQNCPFLPPPPPCSVSRRRPPTAPPPALWRGFPAINSPRAGTHASLCSSSPACCLELEPPGRATRAAEPRNVRAAATSPSRWRARCRSRRPLLASARALQMSQKPIPIALFALSLLPRLGTPPPLHPEPRRAHPTAEPPFQCSSTPTAPTNSFASS